MDNQLSKLKGRKIIVVGCPGSGKSFFARKLRDKLQIPLYYLDCIYWKENWTHLEKTEFLKIQNEILVRDAFILDGTYRNTIENRFEKADVIFFLDIDEETCITSEKKRRGKKREDLPDFLDEKEDLAFIEHIHNFKNEGRKVIIELIEKYSYKEIIVFKHRDETEFYLNH